MTLNFLLGTDGLKALVDYPTVLTVGWVPNGCKTLLLPVAPLPNLTIPKAICYCCQHPSLYLLASGREFWLQIFLQGRNYN